MEPIGLTQYLVLGALLFGCGAVCMATKRNAIGILMGVELVLNGANINFVAFARYNPVFELEGQIFALFVIVMAAAEAAIALAIVLNFYNNHTTVDVDTAEEGHGDHHNEPAAKGPATARCHGRSRNGPAEPWARALALQRPERETPGRRLRRQ